MIRYLKRYKLLLFITILFTTISSLSYVFIAILLQQVMDIVDMGDMEGFIRILLFSLSYFALMGVFMYLQSLFSKKFVCKIMKDIRSKTFIGIERHKILAFKQKTAMRNLISSYQRSLFVPNGFSTTSNNIKQIGW